jgi:2-iminobutanoate/2-iminopropanoate deaminase
MSDLELVSPDAVTGGVPLSPGLRAGDFVYVSGQVARADDGTILIGDFHAEVDGAIDAVESIIAAAGGTLDDVVKIGAYLSNAVLFAEFNEVYAARFTGAVKPTRTTVIVGFGHPDVRVELDAVAYLPGER